MLYTTRLYNTKKQPEISSIKGGCVYDEKKRSNENTNHMLYESIG